MVQLAEAYRDDGGDSDGGKWCGLMEPGGTVRWPVSASSHVPLLVSLLFCQPLDRSTLIPRNKTSRGMAPSGIISTREDVGNLVKLSQDDEGTKAPRFPAWCEL